MKSCCAILKNGSAVPLFVALLLGSTGCVQMAAVWANWTGGDVIEPEYTLGKGPLLILIEDRESIVTEPRALRQLHKTISRLFLEYRVNRLVVPFEDWQALQRSTKSYDELTTRQIGERLGAEHVLSMYVDRFTLHAEPGAPLFKGEFGVRVKVLSTERKRDVRLWPRQEAGRRILATTDPISTDGDKSAGDVANELAAELGKKIAKLFYQHRSLDE